MTQRQLLNQNIRGLRDLLARAEELEQHTESDLMERINEELYHLILDWNVDMDVEDEVFEEEYQLSHINEYDKLDERGKAEYLKGFCSQHQPEFLQAYNSWKNAVKTIEEK